MSNLPSVRYEGNSKLAANFLRFPAKEAGCEPGQLMDRYGKAFRALRAHISAFYHDSQNSFTLAWTMNRQEAIYVSTTTQDADARSYAVPLAEVFRTAAKECPFVSIDPDVVAGAPCIAGTRIPVYGVLDALENHGTVDGVLQSYPRLTNDQVKNALLFAKLVVECPLED